MIFIDTNRDLVLVNSKVADLKTLQYVTDAAIIESMNALYNSNNSIVNEAYALDALSTLVSGGSDLLQWGVPKLLKYLKGFLPDTLEGWIHLGVDAISLVLDILGPFTGGLGNAASAVIDVIHGIYYIGASQGDKWTMFPDRSNKEFEYLLTGFITLGFAAVPIGGNAGSIGFKTYLKKFPIGKNVVVWLEKLFKSSIGKGIKKVFAWIFKSAGSLGKFFYNMFAKMSKIPIIGGIFKFFGNILKDGIGLISKHLDSLLSKFFSKPGVAKFFEKHFGKEFSEHQAKILGQHAAKVGGEKFAAKKAIAGSKDIADELGKEAGKLAKAGAKARYKDVLKALPAYKAIVGKLKMAVTQIIADKIDLTEGLTNCWKLLVGSNFKSADTELEKLKEVGLPVEKYDDWYIDYAFFLDDEDREDNDLSEADVKEIQKYLIQYADAYSATNPPEETGKIDAQTILATRQLFEYLIDQDTSEMEGDELENAEDLIAHCKDGLKELDKLDKSFFTSLKDKITTVTESYLVDFKTFND